MSVDRSSGDVPKLVGAVSVPSSKSNAPRSDESSWSCSWHDCAGLGCDASKSPTLDDKESG